MRIILHTLLNEVSQAVFHGYRGDIHPNDIVFYKNAEDDRWYEGKMVKFAKD